MLNIINPKLGLRLIKNEIEKHVKHPVNRYDLRTDFTQKKLTFLVFSDTEQPNYNQFNGAYQRVYNWDESDALIPLIKSMVSDKIPKEYQIDYALISWDEKSEFVGVSVYYQKDGIKQKEYYQL